MEWKGGGTEREYGVTTWNFLGRCKWCALSRNAEGWFCGDGGEAGVRLNPGSCEYI
jgi:hypothetical protein